MTTCYPTRDMSQNMRTNSKEKPGNYTISPKATARGNKANVSTPCLPFFSPEGCRARTERQSFLLGQCVPTQTESGNCTGTWSPGRIEQGRGEAGSQITQMPWSVEHTFKGHVLGKRKRKFSFVVFHRFPSIPQLPHLRAVGLKATASQQLSTGKPSKRAMRLTSKGSPKAE